MKDVVIVKNMGNAYQGRYTIILCTLLLGGCFVGSSLAQQSCPKTVRLPCEGANRYRFDGSCNNLRRPQIGSTNACHNRILPPAYDNDVDYPRTRSFRGGSLPNERWLSLTALQRILPNVRDDPQYNHNRMSFGQFIAHDITLTPTVAIGPNSLIPDCCNPETREADCYAIPVRSDDAIFGRVGCINFVRSSQCPCKQGAREQSNSVTPFVDLSNIYGLSDQDNKLLRNGSNGLLKGQFPVDHPSQLPLLMPATPTPRGDGCSQPGRPCFLGGDPLRVNQQIGISAWSTLWFRYHNDLAYRLARYASFRNERWSDERIFQTARRIAQAHFQLQVYREWLPTILGLSIHSSYKLKIDNLITNYDQNVDPTLWSEFAAAGFRFGHSMVQNVFTNRDYMTDTPQPGFNVATRDAFTSIPSFYSTNTNFVVENFIAGMYRQRAKEISFSFAPGITNYALLNETSGLGIDLPAVNIRRGRDNAIQPYYKYAQLYLSKVHGRNIQISSFGDLQRFWRRDCLETLPYIYEDVRDVDLYVGELCEIPPESGSVGPTAASIIAMQFSQILYGDRLFVSHKGVFTPAQYRELSRTGWLFWVVCAAGVNQPAAYTNAFRHDNLSYANCDELRPLDISLFADLASDL